MPLTRIKQTAIGNSGITTAKLADGSVTTSKTGFGSETTALKVPVGTTAQRPSGEGGLIRHNTTLGILEQWNANTQAWVGIDSPPVITGLTYPSSQTAADPAGGETVTLTGSNFTSGSTVDVGGTAAASVTLVNTTTVTFVTPAKTAGSYDVKLTGGAGLAATLTNGISYDATPLFSTSNLGDVFPRMSSTEIADASIAAVAAEGADTIDYTITTGSLPTGLTLGTDGVITGTTGDNTSDPNGDTTSNFTVQATDDENQTNTQAHTITLKEEPYKYEIARSLTFKGSENIYFNHFTGTHGNRKLGTMSCWVKANDFDTFAALYNVHVDGSNFVVVRGENNNNGNATGYQVYDINGGTDYNDYTDGASASTSVWNHVVWRWDTDASSGSDRFKWWVNGVEQRTMNTVGEAYPSSYSTLFGYIATHYIGYYQDSNQRSRMQLAEFHYCDGYRYQASDFGEFYRGLWRPKAVSGLSYGNKGFYLNFQGSDIATVLQDKSGNGNHGLNGGNNFDMNDVNDHDTPTNNFATWEMRSFSGSEGLTIYNGGLQVSGGNDGYASMGARSGKWYWECTRDNGSSTPHWGVTSSWSGGGGGNDIIASGVGTFVFRNDIASVSPPSNASSSGNGSSNWQTAAEEVMADVASGDYLSFLLDLDASPATFKVYKNGLGGSPIISRTFTWDSKYGVMKPFIRMNAGCVSSGNFGQDPTMGGQYTVSTTYSDENSLGAFKYDPPSGYKAFCHKNLDEALFGPNRSEDYSDNFQVACWAGNNQTTTNVNVGFQPGISLIKRHDAATSWYLFDKVRGDGKLLNTNSNNEENASGVAPYVSHAFTSTGFDIAQTASGGNEVNVGDMVSWNWRVDGTPAVVTSGHTLSADPTLVADTKRGVSIVKFNIGSDTNPTVPHGLGTKPMMIWMKALNQSYNWDVWHWGMGTIDNTAMLNSTAEVVTNRTPFSTTEPTDTVFTMRSAFYTTNTDIIAYCFTDISGYQAMGTYSAGGHTDRRPYVHCGFEPRMVWVKNAILSGDSNTNWTLCTKDTLWGNGQDTTTNSTMNRGGAGGSYPSARRLEMDTTNSVDGDARTSSGNGIQFTPNGFRVDSAGWYDMNASTGHKYLWYAIGDAPFKYTTGR